MVGWFFPLFFSRVFQCVLFFNFNLKSIFWTQRSTYFILKVPGNIREYCEKANTSSRPTVVRVWRSFICDYLNNAVEESNEWDNFLPVLLFKLLFSMFISKTRKFS